MFSRHSSRLLSLSLSLILLCLFCMLLHHWPPLPAVHSLPLPSFPPSSTSSPCSLSISYPLNIEDRWLSQLGPLDDRFLVNNCDASSNQTRCFGGLSRYYTKLQQARSNAALNNRTHLLVTGGGFLAGNIFANSKSTISLEAIYMKLLQFDVIGVDKVEYQAPLGANLTLFAAGMDTSSSPSGSAGFTRFFNYSSYISSPFINVTQYDMPPSRPPLILAGLRDDTNQQLPLLQDGVIIPVPLQNTSSSSSSSCPSPSSSSSCGCVRAYTPVAFLRLPAPNIISASNIEQVYGKTIHLLEVEDILSQHIPQLHAIGVNKILVFYSILFDYRQLSSYLTLFRHVDVVFHTPNTPLQPTSYMAATDIGDPILFVACSYYFMHHCGVALDFDSKGHIVGYSVENTLLDASVVADPTLQSQIIADYSRIISNASQTILGSKTIPPTSINPNDVRFIETNDGNALADSARFVGKTQIGMINSGTMRSVFKQGDITLANIRSMLPFANAWTSIWIAGYDLILMLEHAIQLSIISNSSDPNYSASGRGRFHQVSGIKFTWNPLAPIGAKVLDVSVLRVDPSSPAFLQTFNLDPDSAAALPYDPLEPDTLYSLTLNDFELKGGDSFSFPRYTLIQSQIEIFDVNLIGYLARFPAIKTDIEGRIVRNTTRFAPFISSISPSTTDLSSTAYITITGTSLFVSSPIDTKVYMGNTLCEVLNVRINNGIQCVIRPQNIKNGVGSVRVKVDSGPLGAVSWTSLYPALFNFTEGSPSATCLSAQGTIFRDGKCLCRAGYTPSNSSRPCVPCPAGSYSEDGFTSCVQCVPGTYAATNTSTLCVDCVENTYTTTYSSTSCLPCPSRSYTDLNLTPRRTRCFCEKGWVDQHDLDVLYNYTSFDQIPLNSSDSYAYTLPSLSCVRCPSGAQCDAIYSTISSARDHFYDFVSHSFLPCPGRQCCTDDSCTIGFECSENHDGFLCSACVENYALIIQHGLSVCKPCSSVNGPLFLFMTFLAVVYIAAVVLYVPTPSSFSIQLLDFLQVCAFILKAESLATSNVEYFQFWNMRVDTAVAQTTQNCVYPLSPLQQLVLHTYYPPMLFGFLLFAYLLCRAISRCAPHLFTNFQWYRFSLGMWQMIILGYIGTCAGAFSLLHCISIGDRRVIYESPSQECYTPIHIAAMVTSIVLLLVLGIVLPAAMWRFIHRVKYELDFIGYIPTPDVNILEQIDLQTRVHRTHSQYERNIHLHDPSARSSVLTTSTSASSSSFFDQPARHHSASIAQATTDVQILLKQHCTLFITYTGRYHFFEIIQIFRRIAIAMAYGILGIDNAIVVIGFICLFFLFYHSIRRVYLVPATHYLHQLCTMCLISLCWIQVNPNFQGQFSTAVSWLFVFTPFVVAVFIHPDKKLYWQKLKTCSCLRRQPSHNNIMQCDDKGDASSTKDKSSGNHGVRGSLAKDAAASDTSATSEAASPYKHTSLSTYPVPNSNTNSNNNNHNYHFRSSSASSLSPTNAARNNNNNTSTPPNSNHNHTMANEQQFSPNPMHPLHVNTVQEDDYALSNDQFTL